MTKFYIKITLGGTLVFVQCPSLETYLVSEPQHLENWKKKLNSKYVTCLRATFISFISHPDLTCSGTAPWFPALIEVPRAAQFQSRCSLTLQRGAAAPFLNLIAESCLRRGSGCFPFEPN